MPASGGGGRARNPTCDSVPAVDGRAAVTLALTVLVTIALASSSAHANVAHLLHALDRHVLDGSSPARARTA